LTSKKTLDVKAEEENGKLAWASSRPGKRHQNLEGGTVIEGVYWNTGNVELNAYVAQKKEEAALCKKES